MCFQSTSTQNTQQQSQNTLPAWATNAGQSIGQNAEGVVNNSPYQAYTGPTTGAFGSTFGTAENNETGVAGGSNANYGSAASSLNQGTSLAAQTAAAPVSSLMSQYTGAALTPTIQAIQQQAAAANQGTATAATAAGAFGDTGDAAQKALNNQNTTNDISNATSSAYNTAYNTALSTQQNALSQLLSGGSSQGTLGQQQTGTQTAANTLLGSLGSTVQSANQTGINTGINVNQSNQLGQLQQDALAQSTVAASPMDSSTASTSNTQSTKPDNTGLGLLGTLFASL